MGQVDASHPFTAFDMPTHKTSDTPFFIPLAHCLIHRTHVCTTFNTPTNITIYNLIVQVGASASGYGLGHALQSHGWNSYLTILSHGTTALALLLTILTFSLTSVPVKGKQD